MYAPSQTLSNSQTQGLPLLLRVRHTMPQFSDSLVKDFKVDGRTNIDPTTYEGKWRMPNGLYSIPTFKKHSAGPVFVAALININSNSTDPRKVRKVPLECLSGWSEGTRFAVGIDFSLNSGFEEIERCMGRNASSTTFISLEVFFGQIFGNTVQTFESFVSPSFVITRDRTMKNIFNSLTAEKKNTAKSSEYKGVNNNPSKRSRECEFSDEENPEKQSKREIIPQFNVDDFLESDEHHGLIALGG
jgi:hypothetical protein